ncbi:Ig-like domain-containing protein, partial [Desulfoplanes sp.]
TNNNDGSFTFDPGSDFQDLAEGETRDVTFTYTATDDSGSSNDTSEPVTVTVTVTGNPTPDLSAADDSASTAEDDQVFGTVATNDATTSGGDLTFAKASDPANGTVTVNADGTYTYTPAANFNGTDEFTYTVTDADSGESLTQTVSITVDPATDLTAADDTATVTEDTVLNGTVAGNDSTTSGGDLTFAKASDPANGTVTVNADGTYTYTPGDNFNGTDEFTYTVTDATSGEALTRTVDITVNPATDLSAGNDTASVDQDTQLTGTVAANDSTTSGGSLSFARESNPANGSVTVNADGSYIYSPNAGYSGDDFFTYTVTDSASGEVLTRSVSITVNDVYVPPQEDPDPQPDTEPETPANTPDESDGDDTLVQDETGSEPTNETGDDIPANPFEDLDEDDGLGDDDGFDEESGTGDDDDLTGGDDDTDFSGDDDGSVEDYAGDDTGDAGDDGTTGDDAGTDGDSDSGTEGDTGTEGDAGGDDTGDTGTGDLPGTQEGEEGDGQGGGTSGSQDSQANTYDLVVDAGIKDQLLPVEEEVNLTIPEAAFDIRATGDDGSESHESVEIQLAATLKNDAPLPDWLHFDPETRTFTGKPPEDMDLDSLEIKVTAKTVHGKETHATFTIIFHETTEKQTDAESEQKSKQQGDGVLDQGEVVSHLTGLGIGISAGLTLAGKGIANDKPGFMGQIKKMSDSFERERRVFLESLGL